MTLLSGCLRYGDPYTEENIAISGTHTHASRGGYLRYMVYTITSMGFVQRSFDAIVDAVENSVIQAHKNMKAGSIYINQGDVDNAGINWGPRTYLMNPEKKRARHTANKSEPEHILDGPHTLLANLQEFRKLTKSMATGQNLTAKGPLPLDLYDVQQRLLVPTLGESPPSGVNFGDVKEEVILPSGKALIKGDRVNVTFWSANPRYGRLTEATFALVERLEGKKWILSYDDCDFCLYFGYSADISGYNGSATIEWEVPQDITPGIYCMWHFGSSKKTTGSPTHYFTGASSSFEVS